MEIDLLFIALIVAIIILASANRRDKERLRRAQVVIEALSIQLAQARFMDKLKALANRDDVLELAEFDEAGRGIKRKL